MRVLAAMLVVLTLGLAACGGEGGSSKPPPAPPPTSAQQSPPPVAGSPGPNGHLTNEEYKAIVREYRRFDALRSKLSGAKPGDSALRAIKAVCVAVSKPATKLVALVEQDCRNAVANRDNTGDLARATQKCQTGSQKKVPACAARAYLIFAARVSRTLTTALKINQELSRRGIGGVCRRSIGISGAAIARLKTEVQAATSAAGALSAGDVDSFSIQVELLQQTLLSESNESDPLPGIIHSCPHAAPKATPKPTPTTPAPRRTPRKPRLRQPGDAINI